MLIFSFINIFLNLLHQLKERFSENEPKKSFFLKKGEKRNQIFHNIPSQHVTFAGWLLIYTDLVCDVFGNPYSK